MRRACRTGFRPRAGCGRSTDYLGPCALCEPAVAAGGPEPGHGSPRAPVPRDAPRRGEDKVALLVFDGLALDQWVQIRESLLAAVPTMRFDEGACFAWLPTLTAVSRQALFSGLRPRGSSRKASRRHPVNRRCGRGSGRITAFDRKRFCTANPSSGWRICPNWRRHFPIPPSRSPESSWTPWTKSFTEPFLGSVVSPARSRVGANPDSCAVSSKRCIALGFHVYLTADHGNVDAIGSGQPKEGVAAEQRGQRVRTYRSEALIGSASSSNDSAFRLDIAGLPPNYLPLFSGGRTAFCPWATMPWCTAAFRWRN
jgi:hypothetical protein